MKSSIKIAGPWLVFLCSLGVLAGQKESGKEPALKNQGQGSTFTFRVPVDVVVVNVTAIDKAGNPVRDLTAADFRVFEDGKAQPIHTFSLETYKAMQESTPPRPQGGETRPSLAAEPASQPRYISLVLDDLSSPALENFHATVEAIKKYLAHSMAADDLVMLYAASGRAEVPFTSDKASLLTSLDGFQNKLNLGKTYKQDCPNLAELQAAHIVNEVQDGSSLEIAAYEYCTCFSAPADLCQDLNEARTEQETRRAIEALKPDLRQLASRQYSEEQHFTRVLLSSLRQHVRSLRHFEGRKSVVFFSAGFIPDDVRFELQDLVDKALRAGVVINTIDAQGLAGPAGLDASHAVNLRPDQPQILGRKTLLNFESASAMEGPLFQLAEDTGGIFFHNNNDLYQGLKRMAERDTYYYVLTYASPSPQSDGRYHKIKLEVTRPDVRLTYRKGYYSPKEQLTFENRKKEDILEAMQAPGNLNQIPVQLSYSYYQLGENKYQLALLTRVEARNIKFIAEDARHRNLINLVLVALDENDRYVDGLEKSVELNLSDASFSSVLEHGFISKVELTIPPGRYKVKAIVREGVQTKMGSITRRIEVP